MGYVLWDADFVFVLCFGLGDAVGITDNFVLGLYFRVCLFLGGFWVWVVWFC